MLDVKENQKRHSRWAWLDWLKYYRNCRENRVAAATKGSNVHEDMEEINIFSIGGFPLRMNIMGGYYDTSDSSDACISYQCG